LANDIVEYYLVIIDGARIVHVYVYM